MGIRLDKINGYLTANHPVQARCLLGGLSSGFEMRLDSAVAGGGSITLYSGQNRLIIFEEEIADVRHGGGGALVVNLDNGMEVSLNPGIGSVMA